MVGGADQWRGSLDFVRNDIASATIGAAERLADADAESIAETLWPEVCLSLRIRPAVASVSDCEGKRATFAQIRAKWRNAETRRHWRQYRSCRRLDGYRRAGEHRRRHSSGLAAANSSINPSPQPNNVAPSWRPAAPPRRRCRHERLPSKPRKAVWRWYSRDE